jgi:hypothetical protein
MLKESIMPLLKLINIERNIIKKLLELGIDSTEELIALAATPNGLNEIAKYLSLDLQAVKTIIDDAKKKLPAELSSQLSRPSELKITFGARKPKRRTEFEKQLLATTGDLPARAQSTFAQLISMVQAVTAVSEVNLIPQLTLIRNQGNRGTCVAFASVAVREFLMGSKQDLSEQYLYWWCDAHDPVPEEPGTTVEMGFRGLYEDGVCFETTWAYNLNPIEGNEGQGPPPAGAAEEAHKYKIEKTIDLDENSITELKLCLKGTDDVPGRPIAFSIPVYNSWFRSKAVELSGNITMPLPGEAYVGGHAMVLVGYQDDSSVPGGGYFIIRNSWGNAWGINCKYGPGYGTIPYKYITDYCWEAFTGNAKPTGGVCFIATAAYGSPYAQEVQFLREFRDIELKSTSGGVEFVKFYENIYYRFSPQIANKMHENENIKQILRWFIVSPIVFALRKAVSLIGFKTKFR